METDTIDFAPTEASSHRSATLRTHQDCLQDSMFHPADMMRTEYHSPMHQPGIATPLMDYNTNTPEIPLRLPTPPTTYTTESTWSRLNPLRHKISRSDGSIDHTPALDNDQQPHQSQAQSVRVSFNSLLIPKSWWQMNVFDQDSIPKHRRRTTKGRPYVVMGLLNEQNEVMKEIMIRINATQTLFNKMKHGTRLLRPWYKRTFSLKEPAGFGIYRCTATLVGTTDFQADIVLDQRSLAALKRMWREYKSRRHVDFDDRWLQWLQKGFNQDGTEPMNGLYGVQVKLRWSARKFVYYGLLSIGLSLATGFGIGIGWRKDHMEFSDYVALWQTASSIASYVVTAAGVAIALAATVTQISE